jgi:hypothetical protein
VFSRIAAATLRRPYDDTRSVDTMATLSRHLSRAAIVIALALPGVTARAQSPTSDSAPPSVFQVETHSAILADAHAGTRRATPSTDASDRHDQAFNIVLGGFFTAASSDLAVSMYRIQEGSARERGFGSWWQDSPVAFAVSKSAMAVAFAYGLKRVHKTRPKTAWVMGIAATSFESWLVVRSARIPQAGR